mmetsp:Transcript_74447/g.131551  ORF Transcript_74447/g.131551 Transcript_74447/m.131551 type:complete len:344 (-) Transcript_74447:834-1865(-)
MKRAMSSGVEVAKVKVHALSKSLTALRRELLHTKMEGDQVAKQLQGMHSLAVGLTLGLDALQTQRDNVCHQVIDVCPPMSPSPMVLRRSPPRSVIAGSPRSSTGSCVLLDTVLDVRHDVDNLSPCFMDDAPCGALWPNDATTSIADVLASPFNLVRDRFRDQCGNRDIGHCHPCGGGSIRNPNRKRMRSDSRAESCAVHMPISVAPLPLDLSFVTLRPHQLPDGVSYRRTHSCERTTHCLTPDAQPLPKGSPRQPLALSPAAKRSGRCMPQQNRSNVKDRNPNPYTSFGPTSNPSSKRYCDPSQCPPQHRRGKVGTRPLKQARTGSCSSSQPKVQLYFNAQFQ